MSGRKKRRPQRSRRHPRARRYPYEDWPAFKPVPGKDQWELDLTELTPEQRAEWDRVEAERERRERREKRMAYRAAVRDGLLPPPWMTPKSRGSHKSRNPRSGSAAAWFDALWPKGEWRLLTGGQCIEAIANAAEKRGLKKWPSDRAIYAELARRKEIASP